MTRVAVTGAAGSVGRRTLEALADYEVTPITHREHDDLDGEVLDIEDRPALTDAFADHDVVVHLAAAASAFSDWESVLAVNVDGTRNVYEAAREVGVERVVFGSSNHVTHMYNVANPADPGTTRADPRVVRADDPFRPSSYYGVSKLAGEGLGSYYADRHGIEAVNLRIGFVLDREELLDLQDEPADRARQARALWLSPRDYRNAIEAAVSVELPENPLTVNLVSRNAERYHTLTHTMRSLGYRPRDDSADVLENV